MTNGAPGADGGGSTTKSYALQFHDGFTEGSASGLQTSANAPIYLYENNGVITGSTSITEGGILAGNTAFTISVDSSGVVTLTQFLAMDHTQTDTYGNSYIADVVSLTNGKIDLVASSYTTDSEGDKSATASAPLDLGGNISFGDDGPQAPTVVVASDTAVALTFDGGLTNGNFTGAEGAGDTNA